MRKRTGSVLCLLLVCTLLFAACGGEKEGSNSGGQARYDGSYYLYDGNGRCDMDVCLRLAGGTWSLGEQELTGAYKITDGKLILLYVLNESDPYGAELISDGLGVHGETVELFSGPIVEGKIVFDRVVRLITGESFLFYLDGNVTDGGNGAGGGAGDLFGSIESAAGGSGDGGEDSVPQPAEGSTPEGIAGVYFYFDSLDVYAYNIYENGTWLDEEGMFGEYRLSGNRITLIYTVDPVHPTAAYLIEQGLVREGETVELFSGIIGGGRLVLDTRLGTPMENPLEYVM